MDRHHRAEGEDEQGHDEAPEVELAAVADRVVHVGLQLGAAHAVQQQDLVADVDARMHRFAEHRRAASPGRGAGLRERHEQVANERDVDDLGRG